MVQNQMAAKTPHAFGVGANGNGNGSGSGTRLPASSSLGTTAVNRNSADYAYNPLSHNAHNGPFNPSASSSSPQNRFQEFYAPSSSSYNAPQPLHHQQHLALPDNSYEQATAHHNPPYQDHEHDHLHAPAPARRPTGKFTEEWDASQRGSSIIEGPVSRHNSTHNNMSSIQRSNSFSGSTGGGGMDGPGSIQVSRSNTLKKKSSLRRSASLGRSGSRRSMKAGSVRSLALQSTADEDEIHSAFFCPVPTTGNPTEALANRFQSWRKILKDLITYFKEIQTFYEQRSKSLVKLANVLNNVHMPPGFLTSGGLDDAVQVLRNHNSQAILEANKAREIEEDVILALTGLRSDLQLKIKEIKNLSGDFKNSVEKEMEVTKRVVRTLQETLGKSELDSALTTGKEDPYLMRLAVDRQLERQLDEENYLHQAYLNLENSGRELESIVVGEIQKSYNALAGILRREADAATYAVEELRVGPIAMPKDHEWASFVRKDDQFVDPAIPIRSFQYIHYPGKDHYACQEIRAGLLERKTKYLKSYTAGWYVLSPTHLHEFKSADKTQSPVMSLYLPEQKLGSHSQETGSSPKFILKGRQTGGVHRGHSWVFRAESYDTMMAWYEDIKALTEKTPQERNDFVRGHSRSFSRTSSRRSVSSDGVVDEDDEEPYSAHNSAAALGQPSNGLGFQQDVARRPSPGGRFPSDIEVNAQRGLQAPLSPSSINVPGSNDRHQAYQPYPSNDAEAITAAGALPGSSFEQYYPTAATVTTAEGATLNGYFQAPQETGYASQPYQPQPSEVPYANYPATIIAARAAQNNADGSDRHKKSSSQEGNWLTDGPVEAASVPIVGGQKTPTHASEGPYVTGGFSHLNGQPTTTTTTTSMREVPRANMVVPVSLPNGMTSPQKRPAASERTESDAPTLSSEVQTISNLHIPGGYPKAYGR